MSTKRMLVCRKCGSDKITISVAATCYFDIVGVKDGEIDDVGDLLDTDYKDGTRKLWCSNCHESFPYDLKNLRWSDEPQWSVATVRSMTHAQRNNVVLKDVFDDANLSAAEKHEIIDLVQESMKLGILNTENLIAWLTNDEERNSKVLADIIVAEGDLVPFFAKLHEGFKQRGHEDQNKKYTNIAKYLAELVSFLTGTPVG